MSTRPAKSASAATVSPTGDAACAQTRDGAPRSRATTPKTGTGRTGLLPSSSGCQEHAERRLGRPGRGEPYTGASRSESRRQTGSCCGILEGAPQRLVPGLRRRHADQLIFVVASVEVEVSEELGFGEGVG